MAAKPRLLVTGAGGMVGQNLLHHPDIVAWEVIAPTSAELDLRDKGAVRSFLATQQVDAVLHAAGVVGGIQANMAAPVRFLADNAEMGLNVVSGCLAAGVTTLVNLSSSCMYPRALGSGLAEPLVLTGELEPTNEGYALAKIVTMRMCQFAVRENPDLRYRTLIPCNLYGKWDKFDPKHSHLLPAIIHKVHEAMLADAPEIEIWGDGTARREFMYAGDLADAILRALADPAAVPETMNVGVGRDHTINEYYETVARVIGWNGKFTHDLSRPVGMKQKLLDVTRQTQWGWSPLTPLEQGIKETYAFYLKDRSK